MTLTFIVARVDYRLVDGVEVRDTVLKHIPSEYVIKVRGEPWPLGSKVDFSEIGNQAKP